MLAEGGVVLGDAADGGAEGFGDADPGAFGAAGWVPVAPAEAECGGELVSQGVSFGVGAGGPVLVVPAVGLGQLLIEVAEALPVGAFGLFVQERPRGSPRPGLAHRCRRWGLGWRGRGRRARDLGWR